MENELFHDIIRVELPQQCAFRKTEDPVNTRYVVTKDE